VRRPGAGGEDGAVAEVRTAHTADLDAATLEAVRALLDDVFDDLTDQDFEHALGGVHALVWEGAELVGHASVIQRRLLNGGRALRTGYVEGVGVRAGQRGRGYGTAMMDALERVVRGAYELGALGARPQPRKPPGCRRRTAGTSARTGRSTARRMSCEAPCSRHDYANQALVRGCDAAAVSAGRRAVHIRLTRGPRRAPAQAGDGGKRPRDRPCAMPGGTAIGEGQPWMR
jgi:GNAT superfamily N-acetyltransferase